VFAIWLRVIRATKTTAMVDSLGAKAGSGFTWFLTSKDAPNSNTNPGKEVHTRDVAKVRTTNNFLILDRSGD
jgi:hypothetical protein